MSPLSGLGELRQKGISNHARQEARRHGLYYAFAVLAPIDREFPSFANLVACSYICSQIIITTCHTNLPMHDWAGECICARDMHEIQFPCRLPARALGEFDVQPHVFLQPDVVHMYSSRVPFPWCSIARMSVLSLSRIREHLRNRLMMSPDGFSVGFFAPLPVQKALKL
jgi:hypothetical protein